MDVIPEEINIDSDSYDEFQRFDDEIMSMTEGRVWVLKDIEKLGLRLAISNKRILTNKKLLKV